jgi:gliding motility-associated-like protein
MDTVTLPANCPDWVFSYSLCCRNGAITNITTPDGDDMYIFARLNNSVVTCNSSPTFSNKPVPFACLNQDYCFSHGASDPDGDSLVYSLITPYQSAGSRVQYLTGFDSAQALSSAPAILFNTATGEICMHPTSLEVTVMAVLVKEYRNGVLIGAVERDLEITVTTCGNDLPDISGMDGTTSRTDTICANAPYCFTVTSSDIDSSQNTFIRWDSTISAATFIVDTAYRSSAQFCWTPRDADISSIPHCFTITVEDDNCPYLGYQVYSYCLTVEGIRAHAGADLITVCNTNAVLLASATGGSGSYTYQWNTGQSGNSISASAGQYIVTANDGLCTNTDTVQVFPGPGVPVAAFTPVPSCTAPTLTLNDNSVPAASTTLTSWSWNFGDGDTATGANQSHVYAAPGTYLVSLVIESSTGCSDTLMTNITTGGPPPVAGFSSTPVCLGTLTMFNDLSTPVSGSMVSWNWDFGDSSTSPASSPYHIFASAGSHPVTLVVQNSTGCTDTITIPYTVYPRPSAFAGRDTGICRFNPVTLTASGGTNYTWSPGSVNSASLTVTPLVTTVYTVLVTDANGCRATDNVAVNVNAVPTADAGNPVIICQGATTTLHATGGGSYLWTPGNASTANFLVTPATTTTYTVVVSTAAGCRDTDNVTVTVRPKPVAVASNDTMVCRNSPLTLVASGGGNYLWTPGSSTSSSIAVSPATTTTYTVRVTNSFGCQDTNQVRVRINPLPTANAGNDTTICLHAGVTLTASGGGSYSWSPISASSSSIYITPLSSAYYRVTVTDANNCSAMDSVQVIVNPLPAANAGNDRAICINGQTTLIATGGGNYFWTPGSFTSDTIVLSPIVTTDYTVRVTDLNGCQASDTVTVKVNGNPVAFAGNDSAICMNSSMTLTASGGGNYSWSPGGSTSSSLTVSPLITTNYTVTVTDSNSCTDNDVIRIIVNPNPVADAGPDTAICLNALTIINASGGSGYSWSPGNMTGSSHSVSPLATTVYTVTVTDTNHCSATDTVTVTVHPNPVAVAEPDTSVCLNTTVLLSGSGAVNYHWMPGNMTSSGISVMPQSTTDYTLTVTDTNGCSSTDWARVVVNPIPVAAFSLVPVICEGENLSLHDHSRIVSGALHYAWDFGNGFQSNLIQPGYSYPAAGPYSIQLTVVSDSGCSDSVIHTVRVNPNPVAAFSVPDVCEMEFASFTNHSTISQPVPMHYKWNFSNGMTDTVMHPRVQFTVAGSEPVKLVVRASGCADSVTHTFHVNPVPTALFSGISVCANSPVIFNNTSAISWGTIAGWQWDFGDSSISAQRNPSHMFLASGPYPVSLIARSSAGCIDTTQAMVYVNPKPVPDFSVGNICEGSPAIFTDRSTISSGNLVRWVWNFGDATFSIARHPVKKYSSPGTYDVSLTVVSDSGCTDTLTRPASIQVFAPPQVSFNATPETVVDLFPHVEFTNLTTGNNLYAWDFGDGTASQEFSPYHDFTSYGVYQVLLVATSPEGCMDSAWQRIEVEQGSGLYIPNSFTPNQDGDNDVFRPVCYNMKSIYAEIFNRWGELIYKWNGTEGGWSGSTNGQLAPIDVYVYKLNATDINGRTKYYQGHVNLVR